MFQSFTMASRVLGDLTASSLFDLTGVVAVVTGGGTVRFLLLTVFRIGELLFRLLMYIFSGYRVDDGDDVYYAPVAGKKAKGGTGYAGGQREDVSKPVSDKK